LLKKDQEDLESLIDKGLHLSGDNEQVGRLLEPFCINSRFIKVFVFLCGEEINSIPYKAPQGVCFAIYPFSA